jgi:hypothetical protein
MQRKIGDIAQSPLRSPFAGAARHAHRANLLPCAMQIFRNAYDNRSASSAD